MEIGGHAVTSTWANTLASVAYLINHNRGHGTLATALLQAYPIWTTLGDFSTYCRSLGILGISPYLHSASHSSRRCTTLFHIKEDGHAGISPADALLQLIFVSAGTLFEYQMLCEFPREMSSSKQRGEQPSKK